LQLQSVHFLPYLEESGQALDQKSINDPTMKLAISASTCEAGPFFLIA